MTSELRNIPPLWNALAYWLSCMFFLQYMPRRITDRKLYFGLEAAFLPVQIGYMYLFAGLDGWPFNLGMAGNALLTLVPFLILCRNSLQNNLYYCSLAFIGAGFTSSFAWQLYIYICSKNPSADKVPVEYLFMTAMYLLFRYFFYLLERNRKQQIYEMNVPWISCASAIIIAYMVYVLSSISFSGIETPFGSSTYAEAFNFRSVIYLAGVAMLYANHIQLCESYVSKEKDVLKEMLNMQYVNYQMNQESVDLINRKYHDLKHQIAILRSEIPAEQKTDYLDRMEKEISTYETQNKTGNQYLDTILSGKNIRCMRENIHMTCVANGAALDFMDVMDMSVLFGNALDNAIEAVAPLPEEERLIHLSVSREKGFARIHVENRCRNDLMVKNCLPGTSKMDTRYHGFGLKSIKKTVEKYNGSMTVCGSDGWFELRILIPLLEK